MAFLAGGKIPQNRGKNSIRSLQVSFAGGERIHPVLASSSIAGIASYETYAADSSNRKRREQGEMVKSVTFQSPSPPGSDPRTSHSRSPSTHSLCSGPSDGRIEDLQYCNGFSSLYLQIGRWGN
ncbi:hypothetical protein CKAN_02365900 [Cinnamomum micranthum f. kanehirae]|uniref:Uncharacterized protein n=1 Tax=Cinnamomum micranthum f. kanehirae TaxID=337451 RepID=A0A3S3R2J3_9MAGN|nr:hypothetical protein CKAN_02365900 [Cinnamomum micranthum f. kanehirae]